MQPFKVMTFGEGDIELFEPQVNQEEEFARIKEADWNAYWKQGFALTGWAGDKPIAFGGIIEIHPQIGECWLFISKHARHREMLFLVKAFRRLLQSELSTAYHRVQMYARADFEPAARMAKLIGMKQEGLLKHYPQKDVNSFLFART